MKHLFTFVLICCSWQLVASIFPPPTLNFVVVLDPGHGGKDSVTKANGVYEKDLVLTIAREIRDHLQQQGFEVIMTRDSDVFVPLSERAKIKGDVFISLHANSVADSIGPSVRSMIKGMEIYTERSMENNPYLVSQSNILAENFKKHLSVFKGLNLRAVRQKSLAVLYQNRSPAIMIELGFLTNEEDMGFLTNKENYKVLSKAFANAIKAYRATLK
ncbi:N-acetylmuramoyl-L-alanine amidase family protein [Desertivirga xinjiangensis]|uniref:N-acetylmuramoyl-L-alanine amidase family protein n=1 Tax=Desertivirga xinjiangensis TaxID=539206 RepID=UPI002108D815|nr:N-acetylmuramoyl-L-alanine amidase [Pedobacter xinjiangensis]